LKGRRSRWDFLANGSSGKVGDRGLSGRDECFDGKDDNNKMGEESTEESGEDLSGSLCPGMSGVELID
jgi:hypothetical protein